MKRSQKLSPMRTQWSLRPRPHLPLPPSFLWIHLIISPFWLGIYVAPLTESPNDMYVNLLNLTSQLFFTFVRHMSSSLGSSVFCYLWDISLSLFIRLGATLGGLWVLSRSSDSTCTLIESMSQAITFSINRRSDTWYCTFIYASPIFTNRCRFWEYLQLLRSQVHGPWLILGDFNECLFSTEVSGGRFNPARVTLLA